MIVFGFARSSHTGEWAGCQYARGLSYEFEYQDGHLLACTHRRYRPGLQVFPGQHAHNRSISIAIRSGSDWRYGSKGNGSYDQFWCQPRISRLEEWKIY